jgi:hypothetical protein
VFSAYELRDGTRIWIITEADRSLTTICFLRSTARLGSDRKIQWPRKIKVGCRETRRSFVLGVRSKEKWREEQ